MIVSNLPIRNIAIGQISVTAKGDSINKAGSVEVITDSQGLVVKGGEVKSE